MIRYHYKNCYCYDRMQQVVHKVLCSYYQVVYVIHSLFCVDGAHGEFDQRLQYAVPQESLWLDMFYFYYFLGHNQPCDLPEDAQGGSVVASKDGTAVPSENMDMKNKMPSGNNTAVNVYVNFQDLSQVQRVTGNNKSTVFNFLHTVLIKVAYCGF